MNEHNYDRREQSINNLIRMRRRADAIREEIKESRKRREQRHEDIIYLEAYLQNLEENVPEKYRLKEHIRVQMRIERIGVKMMFDELYECELAIRLSRLVSRIQELGGVSKFEFLGEKVISQIRVLEQVEKSIERVSLDLDERIHIVKIMNLNSHFEFDQLRKRILNRMQTLLTV